ncbi:MAG: hypothetical protein KDA24_08485 [Deltaproteobacteria bacterium]|nr:hypothetical protein [Deltaproteobacteria bacterium]
MSAALLVACVAPPFEALDEPVSDREVGERAPITTDCGPLDPSHCLLPWPSNGFTVADPSTATGLRVHVAPEALPTGEDPSEVNRADGFSRLTALAVLLTGPLDGASWDPGPSMMSDGPLQLLDARPGPSFGARVPVRTDVLHLGGFGEGRGLVIGHPAAALEANADYVAVVTRGIGTSEETPRVARVALGLQPPENDVERVFAAHHAPTRQALDMADIDLERVVRVWDFTTRSAEDPLRDLDHIRATTAGTEPDVVIDEVEVREQGPVAMVVTGHLAGAPGFLDEDRRFRRDSNGLPQVVGEIDIPLRIVLPRGDDDYPIVLYGHGSGGSISDSAFDEDLAAAGFAKVNLRFPGFTGTEVVTTFAGFGRAIEGTAKMAAGLATGLADAGAVLDALEGGLADALAADTLGGAPNPTAGRRPRVDVVQYVGGSLGGMMGAVLSVAEPRIQGAVLNVPGAGWARMSLLSSTYEALTEPLALSSYPDVVDLQLAMIIGQSNWDSVDGGVWQPARPRTNGVILLQESIGDPVMPNMNTELLAQAMGASQLAPWIEEVPGLLATEGPVTLGATIEQFRVYSDDELRVHGFGAFDDPAGNAAMEQIMQLLTSTLEGSPAVTHPTVCGELGVDGRCDFPPAPRQ